MGSANRALIEEFDLYIENGLKTNMSLDEMSRNICISKYHLHRLFKSITGLTLMSYVRGRKLTSSLVELLETDLNIIDIANEYCFYYEQSYLRAFKRQFGISPSVYRRQRTALNVVNRLDTSMLVDISNGLLITPRYIFQPEFYLIGIKTFIVNSENHMTSSANTIARDFYYNERPKIKGCVNEHIYYGLCLYSDDPVYGNYYMPSVEISRSFLDQGIYETRKIPNNLYAVFRYIGFHSPDELNINYLSEIYNYIDYIWTPNTAHRQSDRYHFERIDLKHCSGTYCEADIYIPVDA